MLSVKRRGPHPSFGSIYFWCLSGVFATAAALAAVRWAEDYDQRQLVIDRLRESALRLTHFWSTAIGSKWFTGGVLHLIEFVRLVSQVTSWPRDRPILHGLRCLCL
jgi:hypothetical protein